MSATSSFPEWAAWLRARGLLRRAREYEVWRLASPADGRRAARLYAKVIDMMSGAADARTTGDLRRRAEALVQLSAAPPLARIRRSVGEAPRTAAAIGALLALLGLVAATWQLRVELKLVQDLARGRPWQSSRNDSSPWATVDLGEVHTFSQLRITNRDDCCQVRAIPLVIQIGDDASSWRTLARRETPFQLWTLRVNSVRARYVRLRVGRESSLQLASVEIYR